MACVGERADLCAHKRRQRFLLLTWLCHLLKSKWRTPGLVVMEMILKKAVLYEHYLSWSERYCVAALAVAKHVLPQLGCILS